MVRTLPWLKAGPATAAQPRPKPPKRRKLLSLSSDSDSPQLPQLPTLPTSPQKHRNTHLTTRTPSTSPPPAPPATSPMRPGLHADDIYMMVEDEFLSTARTFTAHLHHAEYVRLKNAAKNRNVDTMKSISRPVDSITEMRAETKRKKQAEAQEARTRAGIEKIIPKPKKVLGDESEESDFDVNEGQEAPWQGTQLQRFMTISPRKPLTGLTGLQGVTSNTRAAAGFSKPEKRVGSPTPKVSKERQRPTAVEDEGDLSESDSDDDDLDTRSRAPSRPPQSNSNPHAGQKPKVEEASHQVIRKTKPSSPPRPPPKRSFLDMTPLPKPIISKPSTSTVSKKPPKEEHQIPSPGEYDKESPPPPSRDEILARRRRHKAKRQREESKSVVGIRGDEIPIFLV